MKPLSNLLNVRSNAAGKVIAATAATTVLWLLGLTVSWAGMDDIRLVKKVVGVVQVRGNVERQAHSIEVKHWQPLKQGDILSPGTEVRTGKGSRVWLQVGRGDEASKEPSDVRLDCDVMRPNSRVRLNDQHGRLPILQTISGKVDKVSELGKIPAAQYYKAHGYDYKTKG